MIVATPNATHVAGLPLLVEKQIADDAESGASLLETGEAAHVPLLLVGRYRSHNPISEKVKAIVEFGRLGRLVALLEFASGALRTVAVSDADLGPWSWELTSGENRNYPGQRASCYQIGAALGALTVPDLEVWSDPGAHGWSEGLIRERVAFVSDDPLKVEKRQFRDVVPGSAQPFMSGREVRTAVKVVETVTTPPLSGRSVRIE